MKYLSVPVSLLAFQVVVLFGVGTAQTIISSSQAPLPSSPSILPSVASTSNVIAPSSTSLASASSASNVNVTSTSSPISQSPIVATSTSTTQYPSLTGIPSCATTCFETAISDANCSSVVDVNCFCISGLFPQGIVSCISTSCPTLLNTTEQLAQQFCNLATPSSILSFPTPTTTSTVTTGTATATAVSSPASSTTATRNGAAPGLAWERGDGKKMVLVGLGVGVLGLVGGALCI